MATAVSVVPDVPSILPIRGLRFLVVLVIRSCLLCPFSGVAISRFRFSGDAFSVPAFFFPVPVPVPVLISLPHPVRYCSGSVSAPFCFGSGSVPCSGPVSAPVTVPVRSVRPFLVPGLFCSGPS